MDDNVLTLLQFNSVIYKFYIMNILNKKKTGFNDMLLVYGLLVCSFSIDLMVD